jgi:D-alanine-D-alanine ligase
MKVGLVFGGRSVEHEISILSAVNVAKVLEKLLVDVIYYYVDPKGHWFVFEKMPNEELKEALQRAKELVVNFGNFQEFQKIDLFFPLIHGTTGEDGSLQGFFELVNKPYVGPRVLAAAICMDKEVTKKILKAKGVLVVDSITYVTKEKIDEELIEQKIGYPLFVKPASLGSSVGISKVYDPLQLKEAIDLAFTFDQKIMIEKAINGQEIECAVIGAKKPQASLPVKLCVNHDFYSYDAKYLDPQGAYLEAPFKAEPALIEKIRQKAIEIYLALGCVSMARVDFFLTEADELILNEVNTIPGFTDISAFPKAWNCLGVDTVELVDTLLTEALLRFNEEKTLKRKIEHTVEMV